MSRVLLIQNQDKPRRVDARHLKRILTFALRDPLGVELYEIGIHLVGAEEMTRVNETYLQHQGSTDVITFNHSDIDDPTRLHGELYVCVDEAIRLAPKFRTSWQDEVVRYCVHGILHLQGYDDTELWLRRQMKRRENRVMRSVRKQFAVEEIDRNIPPPQ